MKKTLLFSLMAALLAGFGFGGVSLAEEITEIAITSATTSVAEGLLPSYIATSSTVGIAGIEEYGSNTTWLYRTSASSWMGWGGASKTAELGDNHYGLRLKVDTVDGYTIPSTATIIFNGENWTNSGYTTIDPNTWGGYVIIDLGTATKAVAGVRGFNYPTLAGAIAAAQDGDTVTLLDDITLTNDIKITKNINIDLGGKTINGNGLWALVFSGATSEISNGNITSQDPTYGVVYIQYGANVTIKNGTYENKVTPVFVSKGSIVTIDGGTFNSDEGFGLYVIDSTATIKNGTYYSSGNFAIIARNSTLSVKNGTFSAPHNSAIGINTNTALTIENAIVSAQESSIVVETGSSLTIENGTFTSEDNCLIFMNGSAGRGGNTINVNGGTFNGNITSDGAIACGVAASNDDTVNINGGTFNITDGAGIIARGGTTTLGSGVIFNFTYPNKAFGTLGKVGDSRVVVPVGYELVMDVASDYPGASIKFVTINNLTGTYIVANDKDTPDPYVVSAKDGDVVVPLTLVKDGTTAKIPEAPQIIEGYQWYNGDETSPYVFNSSIIDNVTLTLRINTYTVEFDANVEGVANPSPEDVNHGDEATEPQVTNTGYVLLGWYLNDDKFDFTTPITADITLTGRWESIAPATGGAEDDTYASGFVFDAVEGLSGDTESSVEAAVASSNSTAEFQGSAELNVYSDEDNDDKLDADEKANHKISTKVNFTAPVLVRIPVSTTGAVKVKVRHNGESTFTTEGLTTNSGATCTSGVANPAYNGEPITPTSGYVEIWTCSASTFVAYTETANQSSSTSGGGGGGGGSSSYSCKALPANAVANNKTTPKKNMNYSYSTDTGALCTFQCKSGYTRNEETSKCEKADGSEDTSTVDTDKVESDSSDTNTSDADATDTTATEDLQKVLGDGYTVEFHNAYEFAFKNGITTMPSIEAAHMNSALTRIAMAKMLSQYAINVLGKEPANVVVPNFPDVSDELDAQYDNGVTLAYQLGIMGINIDNFRPDDLVTRAEFGTALSRLLFGTPDGENAYYETHLKKLMEEGIITNDNPYMEEVRGYVMIMLMRSASK